MAANLFTPYTTGEPFFQGSKPSWIPGDLDIMRIQAYQLYEEMYWNVPTVFQVSLRGSNEQPIYVPSARTIVDATHRYTAPGFSVAVSGGSTGDQGKAMAELETFLRRERFLSKFSGAKRYGIIKGDWVWHITADPDKPEGSRISITSIDPGMYFPITDDENVDKILGAHLVEYITTPDGPRIRRLTYRKVPQPDGTNKISVEDGIFETDKWEGPTDKPVKILQPVTMLPDDITSLPVYHIKNTETPGDPFGSSELRGLEVIAGALHQVMSDEDLALALDGIGVYATDSSHPIDPATGQKTTWKMGPGNVQHVDGKFFNRVSGVSGLGDSYGAHYNRLWEALKQAASTPDIAIGSVDVQVAASGVALALQLGPMLSKAADKNQLILDTHNQLFYDWLNMWEPAYEGMSFKGVVLSSTIGDAVPTDRVQRFAELNDMLDRGVIDTEYYRSEVSKLGYVFPVDIGTKADAEFQARNADQFAARLNSDANA